ncbi:MAG: hypothetical protein PUI04_10385, partial [Flintibacter sp.]|nr:hypothetical protein [Flintibacter sp.]
NIEQTEMNQMVANIISAMVKDPRFSEAIKEKIGTAVDTADMEKQLEALQTQLRQALGTKSRLERQMDTLDVTDPYYDRKILDLQRRYDEQYGKIEEIEIQIEEVQSQSRSIRHREHTVRVYVPCTSSQEVYPAYIPPTSLQRLKLGIWLPIIEEGTNCLCFWGFASKMLIL